MAFGKKKKEETETPQEPPKPTQIDDVAVGTPPEQPKLAPHVETGVMEFQKTYSGLFTEGGDYKADLLFAIWQEIRLTRRVLERIEKNG